MKGLMDIKNWWGELLKLFKICLSEIPEIV